jgi:pimeloyl-ACP methyl ester carboxylesterase
MLTPRRANTRKRALALALSALVSLPLALSMSAPAQARTQADHSPHGPRHPGADCRETQVPVSIPAIKDAHIYGQLCTPRHSTSTSETVQVLVPGSSYNHNYFDWPQDSSRYSYVDKALGAGYSTFALDRLGTGRSTLPPSALATVDNQTEAVHQVISRLRTGRIEHRAFERVVWVGHSLGSAMGWYEAQKHHDVDAFVLTGIFHHPGEEPTPPGDGTPAPPFIRAMDDPKFAGTVSDPGYWTTMAGGRAAGFFYAPNASQAVINEDERLKDLTNQSEVDVSSSLGLPPAQAPSRAITVPTLVVDGDHDISYCGPEGSPACTPAALLASEQPYYSRRANLRVMVVPDSGHDVQLHKNAPQTDAAILKWVKSVSPQRQH